MKFIVFYVINHNFVIRSFYKQQNALINELIEVNKYDEDIGDYEVELENVTITLQDHCHRPNQKLSPGSKHNDEILAKTVFAINFVSVKMIFSKLIALQLNMINWLLCLNEFERIRRMHLFDLITITFC